MGTGQNRGRHGLGKREPCLPAFGPYTLQAAIAAVPRNPTPGDRWAKVGIYDVLLRSEPSRDRADRAVAIAMSEARPGIALIE